MMEKNEVKEYLKKHFTVREEDPEVFLGQHYQLVLHNIKHSLSYAHKPIQLECFVIKEEERSEKYYREKSTWHELFLVLDEGNGYMESNSSALFLKLYLMKGITAEQVHQEPAILQDYCAKVRQYMEMEEEDL